MTSLHRSIRDLAFTSFNDGDSIPGHSDVGYEVEIPTSDTMLIVVDAGPLYARRTFQIQVTELAQKRHCVACGTTARQIESIPDVTDTGDEADLCNVCYSAFEMRGWNNVTNADFHFLRKE